jgi:hypothetical protein
MADKSDKGFSVVDRRLKDEEPKAETGPGREPGAGKDDGCLTPEEARQDYKQAADKAEATMPPINFPSFLLSLHASALLHLGLIRDPSIGEEVVSMELAQQNISLLEILKDKTRGNLSEDETKLLDNILYELRMAYLEKTGAVGKKECKQ